MNILKQHPAQPPVTLGALQEVARTRWFKTAEIYYILANIPQLISLGLLVSPNQELKSPPGTDTGTNSRRRIHLLV